MAGWKTARVKRPVLIPGSLDGIETGVRQLIREEPLECQKIQVDGRTILVPTEAEILRIKVVLVLRRNAARDYLDVAALSAHLGDTMATAALADFDHFYPQPNGASALQQSVQMLGDPKPYDRPTDGFAGWKGVAKQWRAWENVEHQCQHLSRLIVDNAPSPSSSGSTRSPRV